MHTKAGLCLQWQLDKLINNTSHNSPSSYEILVFRELEDKHEPALFFANAEEQSLK